MPTHITTEDIGLAIRDFVEGQYVHHSNNQAGAIPERVLVVDCTDPNNLMMVTDSGRRFVVHIVAAG